MFRASLTTASTAPVLRAFCLMRSRSSPLPRELYEALVGQARAEQPNECCGLLAGRVEAGVGRVSHRFPLRNELASPREYSSEPRDHLNADRRMRELGIDLLAIYHSHPT